MGESEEVLLEKIRTLEDENKILKEENTESTKKIKKPRNKRIKAECQQSPTGRKN